MRLIDADALMQSLGITNMDCDKCAWQDKEWGCCNRGGDFEDACCAIENAPTIEPQPIIHCKDCKHYNAGFECLIEGYGIERNKDWFCGDAERRQDDY